MNQQLPSPFFRKFMIVFASIICVFYLAYRAWFTFNLSTPYAVFASVFLYVGEFFGIMNLLLYFLQVWEVNEPPVRPVLEGRTVDVLIPTFNEDPALLRATLEACIRMDYPHKTYVLDDGRRPEVETLARELGVIYVSRPDNRHFKAGNLNNALEQTAGEFVVVLDADHVPEPHFISRLIGYFHDDRLAYVQTPHAFYNFDSFQARLDHKNRKYWEEGDLFYRVIQPGRNKWNACIFAGSAAMFRRSALREIGYIATETITEDMHTGLRLHARGWKSFAISERLIAGQAPPDITTFHAQRLRWGEGNLSIMAYDNPLTTRGLSVAQRFSYFGSMIHWASGLFKLAIYLTPIMMLFSGVPPVREFTWELIVVTLTYLFFSLYAMKVVSNGYGSIVKSELFSMVNFWTQTKATFRAMFRRRRQRFVVTQKGPGKGPQKSVWPFVRPQTYLIILSVLAIFWGWMRLSLDLNPFRAIVRLFWRIPSDFTVGIGNAINRLIESTLLNYPLIVGFGISDDYFKPVVPTIWCLIFFWLAYKVTQRAFWPVDRRLTTRHQVHLPVEYEVATAEGTAIRYGVTVDLNDSGMAFVAYESLPINAVIRFIIRGGGEVVKLKGELRSTASVAHARHSDGYRYGVQFLNLTPPQGDAINRMCLHYAVPRMYNEYERGNRNTFWNRLKLWQSRGMAQRRNAKRNAFHLPFIVNSGTTEETTQYSTTEDISRVAAAAIFDNPLPAGSQVGYMMPTPIGEVRGTANVVRSTPEQIAGRTYHRCVLEFNEFEAQGRTTIQSLVNPNENSPLTPVLRPDKKNFLPNMKLPVFVGLLIAIPLILAQMGIIFPFYYKDDQFLHRMIEKKDRGEELTVDEEHEYKRVLGDTLREQHPSTDRLVLLMTVGNKLGERQDIEQVTQYLALRDRKNLSLSKALVVALDNTQKYAQAEVEYARLMKLGERGLLNDADQKELKLAGARVAVHSGRYGDAKERFKALYEAEPNNHSLRNEYAGVSISAGAYDDAIKTLESGPINIEGRKLLIAAHAQNRDWGKAIAEANNLEKETNGSEEAMRLKADLESARQGYEAQKKILTALLERQKTNPDPDVLVKLAQAHNSLKEYDQALAVIYRLFEKGDYRSGAIEAFVGAASQVKGIEKTKLDYDEERARQVRTHALVLYDRAMNSSSDDPSNAIFLSRLGWVFQRLDDNERSSALVNRALEQSPADQNLKQQLAGILLQSGRAEQAARVLGDINSPEARKLLIGIYLEQKDFDKALALARQIAENEKSWKNDKFVADVLSWKGEFAEAIKIYEKHLQEDPSDIDSEARVAEITLWAKFYTDAVARFQALLDTDAKFQRNALKYGDGFINAAASAKELTPAQVKIAERLVDIKLKNATNDPLMISRLAWVMLKVKDKDRADSLLKQIDLAKINRPEFKKEIAGVLSDAGRYKDAIKMLDNPTTDDERLALAKLYSGAREWKAAEDQVNAILSGKPDAKMAKAARVFLADVLSYKGEHDRALEMFAKLRLDYPEDTDLPVREAEVNLWAKKYDKALQMFQALYDKHPTEQNVWLGYVSAASALAAYNMEFKIKPLIPEVAATTTRRIADRVIATTAVIDTELLARLATVMYYLNDKQKADLFMNRALEMKPRDPVLRRELATALSVLKRYKEAIEQYAAITEMTRDDRLRLIDIATSGENLDLAVREARFLVSQDPSNRKDRRLLADVLSWRGDFSEAISLYEQLVRNQPKDVELLMQIGDITLWWRHYPEGLIRFGELIGMQLEQPRVLFGFIDAAASAPSISPAHAKQAMEIYEKVKNDLKDPERLSRLAWIMIKLGQPAKGDPLLRRAVAMNPQDPAVRKEVAGVLTARLYPKQPVLPEIGIEPLSRRWLITSAIELYTPLDPDTDLDVETRINFITLLISSEKKENLDYAERLLVPLMLVAQKEQVRLRLRYGEVLLWSGKYDTTKTKYLKAQQEFRKIIDEIRDDASPLKELARIRLAQSYLWAGNHSVALPLFEELFVRNLVEPERSREVDIWRGFIDALSGRIGDDFRQVKNDEDLDRVRSRLFTDDERKLLLRAYDKANLLKPDPKMREGDPELYQQEIDYYAGTLSRLGVELLYLNEREKSREALYKGLTLISDQVVARKIWEDYARSLMNTRANREAEVIFAALLRGELPEIPR